MSNSTHAVEQAAARGAIVIALSQSQRDIGAAIAMIRNGDAGALGSICTAVDMLVAGYRAALVELMPPLMVEPRVWDISEGL